MSSLRNRAIRRKRTSSTTRRPSRRRRSIACRMDSRMRKPTRKQRASLPKPERSGTKAFERR
nr:MAG TPA: hypothetical protein [Caudoviricetes sp.]